MKIKVTPIFQKTLESNKRIIINEGSSRSSKTYSTIQVLINKALQEEGEIFTIVRKTLPSLKGSAMKDFFEILENYGIYRDEFHNKSNPITYNLHNNEFEFISVDDYSKVKGRKRKYLFMNEANELSYYDYVQLSMRTTGQIFMDYNPSHSEDHWLEEKIKIRNDVDVFKSTYKDNPFLNEETIREIERLKEADPNLWRIYGLGLFGIASARIWTHFELIDEMPENGETVYGLDFGFNHPTALVEVREYDDAYYVDELIYASGLTNNDLIRQMIELGVKKGKFMFCDSAEPNRIEEIRRAGFNADLSDKDVKKGIDTVKSKKIYITKRSINLLKEYKGYSWKTTADEKVLDEPVRINDDGCCALRYAIHSYIQKKSKQPNIRLL
jgi:phage terminase large subunit